MRRCGAPVRPTPAVSSHLPVSQDGVVRCGRVGGCREMGVRGRGVTGGEPRWLRGCKKNRRGAWAERAQAMDAGGGCMEGVSPGDHFLLF